MVGESDMIQSGESRLLTAQAGEGTYFSIEIIDLGFSAQPPTRPGS
jgi:hypothetical protein